MVKTTAEIRSPSDVRNAFNEIESKLKLISRNVVEGSEQVLQEALNIVLQDAIMNAPEETGALKASGKTDIKILKTRLNGTVTFGGSTPVFGKNSKDGIVKYAAQVHEGIFPTSGPFFLKKAIEANFSRIESMFRESIAGFTVGFFR